MKKKFLVWIIPAVVVFVVAAILYFYLSFFGGNEVLYWISVLAMFASGWIVFLLIAHNLKKKKPLLAEYIKSFVYAMMIIVGVAMLFKVSGQW